MESACSLVGELIDFDHSPQGYQKKFYPKLI